MPSRKPDLHVRYEQMLEHDDDAPWGSTDPREAGKINRTVWFVAGGIAVSGLVVGGAFYAGMHPGSPHTRTESQATAGPFVPSNSPSATETSASPSPSKTSASPSPSESKTAAPSPTDLTSPSNIPSPSRSTHKVELPPVETTPAAPETHTSEPETCVWPSTGGVVTVAECGDHMAYNDANLTASTAHELGTGMQFQGACAVGSAVRIEYGGGYDYLPTNGYFAVESNC